MATLQFTSRSVAAYNPVKPMDSRPISVMSTLPSQRPTQLFGDMKQPQALPQQPTFAMLPGQQQMAARQQQSLPAIPSTASSPQMQSAQAVPYGGFPNGVMQQQLQTQAQAQQAMLLQQQQQMQEQQQQQLLLQQQQQQQQMLMQQQQQQQQQMAGQQVMMQQQHPQMQMAGRQGMVLGQMQPQQQLAAGVDPATSSMQVQQSFQQYIVLPLDPLPASGSPVLVQRGVPASDQAQLAQAVAAIKKKSDRQKTMYILLFGMMGYMMWRKGSLGDGRLCTRLEPVLQNSNAYLISKGVNVRFAWAEGTLRGYYK